MSATLSLPRFNGWMLPDDALDIISGLIGEHKPGLVVEAGSGRSTVVIADTLTRCCEDSRLVSLEHLPEFDLSTTRWLAENWLDEIAEVRYAPIVDGWYDPAAWADLTGIDMLIVDGPPGHLSHLAREPALRRLADKLSPGVVVVLDDAHRPQEQMILQRWSALHSGFEPKTFGHSTGAISYGILP